MLDKQAAANSDAYFTTLFEQKIKSGTLCIGVLGLGYVGLPLAQAFCRAGIKVVGFDVSGDKVDFLAGRKSYIKHISDESIATMVDSGLFTATTGMDQLSEPDAILICVPTPLDEHRGPDMSYVVSSTEMIGTRLRKGQLIVLESTTYPGTTNELMLPTLEKLSGLQAGREFALAYSPEREDPGNPKFETSTIPKVLGADSTDELDAAYAIYSQIVPQVVKVSDLRTAEAVKLTENIFRAVNIALVNELKVVFSAMGIDVWEVIDAAATKPFGFMPFYPGPGLGGHCIPVDPFYLSWKAREYGLTTRFIELSGEINANMPGLVITRLTEELSLRVGKAMRGARILLVGLAYKKNVDDMRESPSLELLELLETRGAHVDFYDPYIPQVPQTRDHPEYAGRKSIEWSDDILGSYDAALIATDHDNVDYRRLLDLLPLVVDTRNACGHLAAQYRDTLVKT
ncbi:UDP-N-acetyl-D-glucosamine dehydrogenase [Glycocaulis albus]|uniref:UDP-N-acetyl-D-glucosamine dehydrogenase n=1 Tax=Glycocaulis albus TaxID=1382801 RepID=A0ABQ1Y1L8_9PROT|nr:nucleotide sugar dehydrogenase [Glycocaulis albus]GGH08786.1 UDP-N-acetyl-D-glucosamine dehydrogenase [Glycocaulis albus]